MTYSGLLKKCYGKAPLLSARLSFMLGISNKSHIEELRNEFKEPPTFISDDRMDSILFEVPQEMIIDGKKPFELLYEQIPKIRDTMLKTVRKSNDQIRSAIAVQSLGKDQSYMENFGKKIKDWNCDPVKNKHFQRVEKAVASMQSEYEQLRESFKTTINTIGEIKSTVENRTKSLNSVCDHFEEGVDSDHCIPDLVYFVVEISKLYTHLIKNLACLKEILTEYNDKRIVWAEFLIEMRNSPTSGPKPIKKKKKPSAKQLAKEFAALALESLAKEAGKTPMKEEEEEDSE